MPFAFATAALMRVRILPNGDFTGTWHGKIGPMLSVTDVAGNLKVNPDGTAEATLTWAMAPGVTNHSKAVFFDEGKHGYLIPLVNDLPGGAVKSRSLRLLSDHADWA
jgi:hypothetical protein